MSESADKFVYEIVDIPANFEIDKLKEFCKKIAAKQKVPSLKNSSNDSKDFLDEDYFETSNDKSADKFTESEDYYSQKRDDSCEGFILHIGSNPDPEAVQKTFEIFENIFENMTIKINTSSKSDSIDTESTSSTPLHLNYTGKQLSKRRIRKSFLYCQ